MAAMLSSTTPKLLRPWFVQACRRWDWDCSHAKCPAAAVTAILAPKGVDSSAIVKEFRERFSMVVANGQGEMKGQLFRIAHLGYYDYLDAIGVIGALEHVLLKVAPSHNFELGAGVRAVQEVFAGQFAEVAKV